DLSLAGGGSRTKLLDTFQVSVLHNLVHVLLGIIGLACSRTAAGAGAFLTAGGVALLALWVVGVVGVGGSIPLGPADNWLHFVLGIVLTGLGAAAAGSTPRAGIRTV